ncbi:MAG: hypothetical protein ABSH47_06285 [Bryobacteraceae bacterium]|jgi:hypothetical protein
MSRSATRPRFTGDLSQSERRFAKVLQQLRFGRLESIRIRHGAPVLDDPGPTAVQVVKFGSTESTPSDRSSEFELKKPLAELFEYIRGVDDGEIRHLEVRHGLPFSMEIEHGISRGMPDVEGEHVGAV